MQSEPLSYRTGERIRLPRPVDRIAFIAEHCRGKRVVDLGCFDETALGKRETEHWLHGRIAAVAGCVTGIDNSELIPIEGLATSLRATIVRGDATDPPAISADVVVAGELLEHLPSPLLFLQTLKHRYPGAELLLSTPNGGMFANSLLGIFGREAQHPDHLQLFTYKSLNTLCCRAHFEAWEIVPYRFFVTESMLASVGPKRWLLTLLEMGVRAIEWCFPLLSYGYVVRARI